MLRIIWRTSDNSLTYRFSRVAPPTLSSFDLACELFRQVQDFGNNPIIYIKKRGEDEWSLLEEMSNILSDDKFILQPGGTALVLLKSASAPHALQPFVQRVLSAEPSYVMRAGTVSLEFVPVSADFDNVVVNNPSVYSIVNIALFFRNYMSHFNWWGRKRFHDGQDFIEALPESERYTSHFKLVMRGCNGNPIAETVQVEALKLPFADAFGPVTFPVHNVEALFRYFIADGITAWGIPLLDQKLFTDAYNKLTSETWCKSELHLLNESCLRFLATEEAKRLSKSHAVLLYGPPGTGKSHMATQLIKHLMNQTRRLFSGSSTEFLRSFVGEAEQAVKVLFDKAKETPHLLSIIFLDEMDSIGGQRSDSSRGSSDHKRDLVNALLPCVGSNEYRNVLVIGATNFKDMLDTALMRPGRMETHIFCAPLREAARLKAIAEFDWVKDAAKLRDYVRLTTGFTAAALNSVLGKLRTSQNPESFDQCKALGISSGRDDPLREFTLLTEQASRYCGSRSPYHRSIIEDLVRTYKNCRHYTGRIIYHKKTIYIERSDSTCFEKELESTNELFLFLCELAQLMSVDLTRVMSHKVLHRLSVSFSSAVYAMGAECQKVPSLFVVDASGMKLDAVISTFFSWPPPSADPAGKVAPSDTFPPFMAVTVDDSDYEEFARRVDWKKRKTSETQDFDVVARGMATAIDRFIAFHPTDATVHQLRALLNFKPVGLQFRLSVALKDRRVKPDQDSDAEDDDDSVGAAAPLALHQEQMLESGDDDAIELADVGAAQQDQHRNAMEEDDDSAAELLVAPLAPLPIPPQDQDPVQERAIQASANLITAMTRVNCNFGLTTAKLTANASLGLFKHEHNSSVFVVTPTQVYYNGEKPYLRNNLNSHAFWIQETPTERWYYIWNGAEQHYHFFVYRSIANGLLSAKPAPNRDELIQSLWNTRISFTTPGKIRYRGEDRDLHTIVENPRVCYNFDLASRLYYFECDKGYKIVHASGGINTAKKADHS
eukprot:TRINITY_DN4970_c0_g1_i1.p1 TRINITY_DN4970_c0_g1~~TRINITY_DN4970_c0_g1_i1.p1  ORF type:complete len:1002 (+),score=115.44 TRINITY_DN4970_c0_g1_i1:770-3775(+)